MKDVSAATSPITSEINAMTASAAIEEVKAVGSTQSAEPEPQGSDISVFSASGVNLDVDLDAAPVAEPDSPQPETPESDSPQPETPEPQPDSPRPDASSGPANSEQRAERDLFLQALAEHFQRTGATQTATTTEAKAAPARSRPQGDTVGQQHRSLVSCDLDSDSDFEDIGAEDEPESRVVFDLD